MLSISSAVHSLIALVGERQRQAHLDTQKADQTQGQARGEQGGQESREQGRGGAGRGQSREAAGAGARDTGKAGGRGGAGRQSEICWGARLQTNKNDQIENETSPVVAPLIWWLGKVVMTW